MFDTDFLRHAKSAPLRYEDMRYTFFKLNTTNRNLGSCFNTKIYRGYVTGVSVGIKFPNRRKQAKNKSRLCRRPLAVFKPALWQVGRLMRCSVILCLLS